jgi:hypothetical protein
LGPVVEPRDVRRAYDLGINCFALATDLHWPRYESLRNGIAELLQGDPSVREQIVLVGVSYSSNRKFCHSPFQELLDALPGVAGLDVSAMGAVNHTEFLVRWTEHQKHLAGTVPGVKALAAFFDESISAYVAVTRRMVDLAFVPYRPATRRLRSEFFERVGTMDVPIFSHMPALDEVSPTRLDELGIVGERWRPQYADYLRYALGHPEVRGVYCTARRPGQLDQIAKALEAGPLTEEETAYLEDLSDLNLGLAELAAK